MLAVKKASLKETHTRKINVGYNHETMYTSSKQDKEKYVGMTLDSKLSTLYPPNTGEVIDSNDETEITENCLEDYCESMIDYNHTNFHMIRKTVKKEHRALRASIDLFKKSNLSY